MLAGHIKVLDGPNVARGPDIALECHVLFKQLLKNPSERLQMHI